MLIKYRKSLKLVHSPIYFLQQDKNKSSPSVRTNIYPPKIVMHLNIFGISHKNIIHIFYNSNHYVKKERKEDKFSDNPLF
jgi:hypothetical protein